MCSAAAAYGKIRSGSMHIPGSARSMTTSSSTSATARWCSRGSPGSKICTPAPSAGQSADQQLADVGLAARPGDPQMTRLAGFSRFGAPSRSSRTMSRSPGVVRFIPSGTPVRFPSVFVRSGTNLANRSVVVGLRNSPSAAERSAPGLNARQSVVWLSRQRRAPMFWRQ